MLHEIGKYRFISEHLHLFVSYHHNNVKYKHGYQLNVYDNDYFQNCI